MPKKLRYKKFFMPKKGRYRHRVIIRKLKATLGRLFILKEYLIEFLEPGEGNL
jgi:hypothetical protein